MTAWQGRFPADAVILDEAAPAGQVQGHHLVLQLFAVPPANCRAMAEAAGRIPQLLHDLDQAASATCPGRLCVLLPRRDDLMSRAADALTETLVRYGAGHLAQRPVQVNLLRHPPTPEGRRRAADMVRALFGGQLDSVRGQVLDLRDLGEACPCPVR